MRRTIVFSCFVLISLTAHAAYGQELATASSARLLQVYAQLRSLRGGSQGAPTTNVVWKRDAATFTFHSGSLTFAAPVADRVVAAFFQGNGTFELDPPTAIERRHMARFAGGPKLVDGFHNAVFFFTDDSWAELRKLVHLGPAANSDAATQAFLQTQRKFAEHFNAWGKNPSNPRMSNLAARMLADLSDPSSRGLFLADFKGQRSGNLLFEINWNRPQFLLPEIPNDEQVMLLHYRLGKYFEWWAGFHASPDRAANPRPEPPSPFVHCAKEIIDADISKENTLSATAEMDFQVERGTPRILPVNLSGLLRISSIADGQNHPLTFIQESPQLDSGPWLILPAPAKPGNSYTIKISYREHSTPKSPVISQFGPHLYSVFQKESWYPHFGPFEDSTMFDLRFHSPGKYKLLAAGDRISSKKSGGELISEWKSPMPFRREGFSYGDVISLAAKTPHQTVTAYAEGGIADLVRRTIQRNTDAALGERGQAQERADAAFGIRREGSSQYGHYGAAGAFVTWSNTELSHLSLPSLLKQAATVSTRAMRLFRFYYGPLPFHSLSVAELPYNTPVQSWPTTVMAPAFFLLSPEAGSGGELRYQSNEYAELRDTPALSAIARQWWGRMVGYKTYHDQWLSQGIGKFSADLYFAQFEPKVERDFWDLDYKQLFTKDMSGQRPIDAGPLWLNEQTRDSRGPYVSSALLSDKGAYVLEALRLLMEQPRSKNPDAAFIAMMRDFAQTYAGKRASTQDFEKVVAKHMGRPMDWFFNEWVYGTGIPHYDLKYKLTYQGGDKTLLALSVTQSGVSNDFVMKVPVDAVLAKGKAPLGLLTIRGPNTVHIKVMLPVIPRKIELDPDHRVLCSITQ